MSSLTTPGPLDVIRPYHLLTDEHESIREALARLLERRLQSSDAELASRRELPDGLMRDLGDLGYLGAALPVQHGGTDDPVAAAVLAHELGRSGYLGVALGVIQHLVAARIVMDHWPVLDEDLASGLLGGEVLAGLALGEAHNDPDESAVTATATETPDGLVLNGRKTFLAAGGGVQLLLAPLVFTEDGSTGWAVLPLGTSDLEPVDSLGCEQAGWCDVSLNGKLLAPANVLPAPAREVYVQARSWLRILEAFALVGLARSAVETGVSYATEREVFGHPVMTYQTWRHRWAEAATDCELANALCLDGLRKLADGDLESAEIPAARVFAGQMAMRAADECVQVHGGYGYMMEYSAQRFWRDTRQASMVLGGDVCLLEAVAAGITPLTPESSFLGMASQTTGKR